MSLLLLILCAAQALIHLQSTTAHLYLPDGTDLAHVVVAPGLVSVTDTVIIAAAGESVRYVGKCPAAAGSTVAFEDLIIELPGFVGSAVLEVDLSCDSLADVTVGNVTIDPTGACAAGPCADAGVLFRSATSLSLAVLDVHDNAVTGGADAPALRAGVEVRSSVLLTPLAAWQAADAAYDPSPPSYQVFARNVRRRNPRLTGVPYDVALADAVGNTNCEQTCRLSCRGCLADPTRNEGGVCDGLTRFPDLARMAAACPLDEGALFPTSYEPTVTTFNRTAPFRVSGLVTDAGPGPEGGEDRARPLVRHAHAQAPTPWETDPHSIWLALPGLAVEGVDFSVESDYLSPFHGAVLFTVPAAYGGVVDSVTLRDCGVFSTEPTTFLFDSVAADDRVTSLAIEDSLFDGLASGLVPDGLGALVFTGNTVRNDTQFGAMDVAVAGPVTIAGNHFVDMVTFNTGLCTAVVCLSDTPGPANISGNVISALGGAGSAGISLCNVSDATVEGNTISGAEVGIDVCLPCNSTTLYELKQANPDAGDLRCGGTLTCSGTCLPPVPPPPYCEVSWAYTPATPGWLHSRFDSLSAAVAGCAAAPEQTIYVWDELSEAGGIVFARPFPPTQTSIAVRRHPNATGSNPVVYASAGHTLPEHDDARLLIDGVDFVAAAATPTLLEGHAVSLTIRNSEFRAWPATPTGPPLGVSAPLVDTLVSVSVDLGGEGVLIEDSALRGAMHTVLRVDDHPYDDAVPIVLRRVEMSHTWGAGFLGGNLWDVTLEDVGCTVWCGGMASVDAVHALVLRDSGGAAPLRVDVTAFQTSVNASDPTLALFPTTVPGGFGDRAGLWLEGPAALPSGSVTYVVRNVSSVGHPVAARLVDVPEDLLELNEIAPPLAEDILRPLRELARVNTLEGAVHDVKKGAPTLDLASLDVTHTCDDLCPSLVGAAVCEVNAAFSPATDEWGTRRFADVATALDDCTVTLEPLPVQLVRLDAAPVVHVEDVTVDRPARLFGEEPALLVTLQGEVTVLDTLVLEALTLDGGITVGAGVPPGATLRLQAVDALPSTTPVLTMNAPVESVTLTTLSVGAVSAAGPAFDIQATAEVTVATVDVAGSSGVALRVTAPLVLIDDSLFRGCLAADTCVDVTLPAGGRIITGGSRVTVAGDPGTGGRTAVRVAHTALPVTSPGDALELAVANLQDWTLEGDGLGVGLRLPGFEGAFTPAFTSTSQGAQKAFVRQVSALNPGIGASAFYDVVLSDDDAGIAAAPKALERLWCSDLCPTFAPGSIIIFVVIGALVLLALVLLCAVAGPRLLGRESPELRIARAEGRRRRRKRKARKGNELALLQG